MTASIQMQTQYRYRLSNSSIQDVIRMFRSVAAIMNVRWVFMTPSIYNLKSYQLLDLYISGSPEAIKKLGT